MAINMNETITGVTLTKVCSVKPDADSDESKTVTVNVKYDGLTLHDVFEKALAGDIIKFQASARKHFTTLKDVENIDAKSPGRAPQVQPEVAIKAKMASMNKTEKQAYINSLLAEIE